MHLEYGNSPSEKRIHFGLYEADLKAGELYKGGHRIALQSQPFQVLAILLERAGEIVTKDEFRHVIWGEDIIVDFDQSLRAAVTKTREVLGDSSESPRFIETVPRRGYRFIAPVAIVEPTNLAAGHLSFIGATPESEQQTIVLASNLSREGTQSAPSTPQTALARFVSKRKRAILESCAGLLFLLICSLLWYTGTQRHTEINIPALHQLTFDSRIVVPIPTKYAEQFPAMVTDGKT